jgi:hypothetical protein
VGRVGGVRGTGISCASGDVGGDEVEERESHGGLLTDRDGAMAGCE